MGAHILECFGSLQKSIRIKRPVPIFMAVRPASSIHHPVRVGRINLDSRFYRESLYVSPSQIRSNFEQELVEELGEASVSKILYLRERTSA